MIFRKVLKRVLLSPVVVNDWLARWRQSIRHKSFRPTLRPEASDFVNALFTHIEGVSPLESAEVLSFLYGACVRFEYTCRFNWAVDSLVLWDNQRAQTGKRLLACASRHAGL